MRTIRLEVERFRSIRQATFFPGTYVYLVPNNLGKTAVLEELNLLLPPEIGTGISKKASASAWMTPNGFHQQHLPDKSGTS